MARHAAMAGDSSEFEDDLDGVDGNVESPFSKCIKRFFQVDFDSDAGRLKWGPILLLYPMLPALASLITILGGNYILLSSSMECGYPLDQVLGGAVVLSYIFFGYYSWLFLGPLPVTKLRPVAIFYVFFTFFTFVWYLAFTGVLALSWACVDTAPALYTFSSFSVISFWIGIGVTITFFGRMWKRQRDFNNRDVLERDDSELTEAQRKEKAEKKADKLAEEEEALNDIVDELMEENSDDQP